MARGKGCTRTVRPALRSREESVEPQSQLQVVAESQQPQVSVRYELRQRRPGYYKLVKVMQSLAGVRGVVQEEPLGYVASCPEGTRGAKFAAHRNPVGGRYKNHLGYASSRDAVMTLILRSFNLDGEQVEIVKRPPRRAFSARSARGVGFTLLHA